MSANAMRVKAENYIQIVKLSKNYTSKMLSISIAGCSTTQKHNNCTKIYQQSCLEVLPQKFKYVNIQMHN